MEHRFLADSMLGKLATWLRIIGCDVLYFKSISGDEIIEKAIADKRTILTRDTLLIKRRSIKNRYFFVEGDDYRKQLKQVAAHFNIEPLKNIFTRCLLCNNILEDIQKEFIKDSVPPYVFETQKDFKICPSCNKVYWQATHKNAIIIQLKSIFSVG